MTKFTTLIDELISATDESLLNLKFMELTTLMMSKEKPTLIDFIEWAKTQESLQATNLISLCLDTYVPYSDAVVKLIDPQWVMIHALPKDIRNEISRFFSTTMKEHNYSPMVNSYTLTVAIHLSSMKYSGIFSEFCFDIFLSEMAQRFETFELELLNTYSDEFNNFYPEKIIKRLIQVTAVFYGNDVSQELLIHFFGNKSKNLNFVSGWENYEEWFKSLVQQDLVNVCKKIETILDDAKINYSKSVYCYCQDWNLFDIKLNDQLINEIKEKYPSISLG